MRSAKDYPVTDPFGATYYPWSKAHPHLGEDRSCPCGTPVVVSGTLIGLVGSTGKSSGCHVHTQEVEDGRVVNPDGGGFDIPTPAVVYQTGQRADIGKYVRIRDAKGVEWSHFHLSEIKVSKGQEIGDDMLVDTTTANIMYRLYLGIPLSEWGKKNAVGKMTPKQLVTHLKNSNKYKKLQEDAKGGRLHAEKHLPVALRSVYKEPNFKPAGQLYVKE